MVPELFSFSPFNKQIVGLEGPFKRTHPTIRGKGYNIGRAKFQATLQAECLMNVLHA